MITLVEKKPCNRIFVDLDFQSHVAWATETTCNEIKDLIVFQKSASARIFCCPQYVRRALGQIPGRWRHVSIRLPHQTRGASPTPSVSIPTEHPAASAARQALRASLLRARRRSGPVRYQGICGQWYWGTSPHIVAPCRPMLAGGVGSGSIRLTNSQGPAVSKSGAGAPHPRGALSTTPHRSPARLCGARSPFISHRSISGSWA